MKVEIELYTENDKLRVIQKNKIKKSKKKKPPTISTSKIHRTHSNSTAVHFDVTIPKQLIVWFR